MIEEKYCIFSHYFYGGDIIDFTKTETAEGCQIKCKEHEKCQVFNWGKIKIYIFFMGRKVPKSLYFSLYLQHL